MSASDSRLETRVAALEDALGLPSTAAAAPAASASAAAATEVAVLTKALRRAEYRIEHLVHGLEAATLRAEAAEAQRAAALAR